MDKIILKPYVLKPVYAASSLKGEEDGGDQNVKGYTITMENLSNISTEYISKISSQKKIQMRYCQ